MHVLATAGHVDHGKSALLLALTGMEPDRWDEEKRRGMTLDLGFVWTTLGSGQRVAFVDVPGHQRFVPTMLAGVGPVPAVLFVVAADEGWKQQSTEHLAAIDALNIQHGLVAVTRSDLADPARAIAQATEHLQRTSLSGVENVVVSVVTGQGIDQLREALDRLAARLPAPQPDVPVRLWIDRSFTIRGAGTIVTGTLSAGRIIQGDELTIHPGGRRVTIRSIQMLGEVADTANPVARVALNLRGVSVEQVQRGNALLTPNAWLFTATVDVRVRGEIRHGPLMCTLHIGSTAVPTRFRRLGEDTARLTLDVALPLRIGDTALLRNPGRHHIIGGVTVLDPQPLSLGGRRGAARRRAGVLASMTGTPNAREELRRRHIIRTRDLRALGVNEPVTEVAPGWVADPQHWAELRASLIEVVSNHRPKWPLVGGLRPEAVARLLDLPETRLLKALATDPLEIRNGYVALIGTAETLPPDIQRRVDVVCDELTTNPWVAPTTHRLDELGLGPHELAAAVRIGRLEKIDRGIYLLPGALATAYSVLQGLPQPFSVSQARAALNTSRRVAVPLLETLDARRLTRQVGAGGERLTNNAPPIP